MVLYGVVKRVTDLSGKIKQDNIGKEEKLNKVTELSNQSTHEQYPSAKCVYEELYDVRQNISLTKDYPTKWERCIPTYYYHTMFKADGTVQQNNNAYNSVEITLERNMFYRVTTSVAQSENLCMAIFRDENDNVVGIVNRGNYNERTVYEREKVDIPPNAVKMFVTCYVLDYDYPVVEKSEKYFINDYVDELNEKIKESEITLSCLRNFPNARYTAEIPVFSQGLRHNKQNARITYDTYYISTAEPVDFEKGDEIVWDYGSDYSYYLVDTDGSFYGSSRTSNYIFTEDKRLYIEIRKQGITADEEMHISLLKASKVKAVIDSFSAMNNRVEILENKVNGSSGSEVELIASYPDRGFEKDTRFDLATGNTVTGSNNQCLTDFLAVSEGTKIITNGVRFVGLYDSDKNYLSYINLYSDYSGYNAPPSSWSGNYRLNITEIEKVGGVTPAYIRCWGSYDQYDAAVSVLTSEAYEIVNLGDSIFGNNEKPYDISTYIQNITGKKTANCAYGGTTARVHHGSIYDAVCLHSIADCISTGDFSSLGSPSYWREKDEMLYTNPTLLLQNIDWSKVKLITIAFGTNDWNLGGSTYQLIDNENNSKDILTYKGALRYSVEKIWDKYPSIQIAFLSPLWRMSPDADNVSNAAGQYLHEYVTAMKEVAEEYYIPFFDNYSCGINRYNSTAFLRDGTHLTRQRGAELVGKRIGNQIKGLM